MCLFCQISDLGVLCCDMGAERVVLLVQPLHSRASVCQPPVPCWILFHLPHQSVQDYELQSPSLAPSHSGKWRHLL